MVPHRLVLFEEDLVKPINLTHLLRALLLSSFVSVFELFHHSLFPVSNVLFHTPKNKGANDDYVTG